MGLMECSHPFDGHHAGLAFFDEPKQQSAKDASLEALLRRAATTLDRGQQVIIFTSEPDPSLTSMIANLDVRVTVGGLADAAVVLPVKINYQTTAAPLPAGYLKDDGSIYADRDNGYIYGWNVREAIEMIR